MNDDKKSGGKPSMGALKTGPWERNVALTRMGVDVKTSTRVTNCHQGGVDLEHGRIDAGTIVWAAGVVASLRARLSDAAVPAVVA